MRLNFKKKCAIAISFSVTCFVAYKCYFENGDAYDLFQYDVGLVNTSLDSMNRALNFFSTVEEGDLVFDVLIGIRIVMEQSWLLHKYLARKEGLKSVLGALNEVIEKTDKIFDNVFDALMRTQAKTMNEIGHIVSTYSWSHWTVDALCVNANLRYEQLNISDENGDPVYVAINECLTQYKRKCLIDDHCWRIMTEPGSQQYELSHQLMFVMLAEKYGCYERMNFHIKESGQVSLLNLKTIFCSNMFNETTEFADTAMEKFWLRDLFIEQGFHQFTNNKQWIRNIIGWQHTSGCWPSIVFPERFNEQQHTEKNTRRKRSDNIVGSNNCSLHTTTLAIGALIVNIKNDFIQLFETSNYRCRLH